MTDAAGPEVDLLDRAGRLRRTLLAIAAGVVVAVIVGVLAYVMTDAGGMARELTHAGMRGRVWKFILFFAALAGGATFLVTRWALRRVAGRSR